MRQPRVAFGGLNVTPNSYEELTRLVSSLLDGCLSIEESAQLESLLQSDAAARRIYMQLIDLEIELSCRIASADPESRVSLLATMPARHPDHRRQVWALAMAAVVLLAATVLALLVPKRRHVESPQFAVTQTWSEDFEQGIPAQWFGRIVSDDLPVGSKHGIATAAKEYPPAGSFSVIQLPADWIRGLVALTTNSTLHVTYQLHNPGTVNVFMHTLPPEGEARSYEMFQLFPAQFPAQRGVWQTASIPFSSFVRKVMAPAGVMEFAGGPPVAGERITTLAFSSPEKIDFVIDRLWITPSGNGRETIQPLQNNK